MHLYMISMLLTLTFGDSPSAEKHRKSREGPRSPRCFSMSMLSLKTSALAARPKQVFTKDDKRQKMNKDYGAVQFL